MIALLAAFRRFLVPYRLTLAVGTSALIGAVLLELAQPWPLKLIVDSVLGDRPLPDWFPEAVREGSVDVQIAVLSLSLLAIVGLAGLLTYLGTYRVQSTGQRMVTDLREAVHTHLHRLTLAYHHAQRPGDLVNRLTSDAERVQNAVVSVVVSLVTNVLMLVGMLTVMLIISWQFTLLALASVPVLALATHRYTHGIKRASRSARKREGRLASLAHESLSAIHLVQAYAREELESERFRAEARESLEYGMRATALQARFSPIVDVLTAVATVTVLWVGAHQVRSGELTLGLLLVFLSYVRGFYSPIRALSKLSYVVAKGAASAERLVEVLDTAPALPVARHPHRPASVDGLVRFEDVTFTYPLGHHAALRDVSLVAPRGEVTALVGRTGAGKSTIAGLIPRFYDVEAGHVTVDGVDVREWDLRALRDATSLVLQDTFLFQGTIRENIAYGRPEAGLDEIVAAAVAAHAHEFVDRLPDGYETVVGPRGATLSGGQRQRVAIARALLRDAPILILDEPTAGLDAASEALVLDALERLVADRTTILIAHGEAPILRADRVFAVEDGRIVDQRGAPAHRAPTAPEHPG
jgi:ATP-binding cassette, subfamily B, bacterial